ncbi:MULTISPECIES: hypothetical protein [Asticcacaulis]|uniref:hypothetical protein n=1 Tax=Asticcacaulis TaxID=76890 RepID=UPI001FD91B7F|nr:MULTISPECIES: hypothetical protein [Asticcacaulis]MBP2159978.1 hypothetical protein [Asticcacaulis solisilvae]MDR6801023.1 hypothetical protein [Asticcacaulis sp. BE141]
MPEQATLSIDSLKRDAARLLKQARAGDDAALKRFTSLRSPPETLQLKHALAVVADEAGFDSWTELKQAQSGLDFSEFFAGPSFRDSLNPWFNNYEEARAFSFRQWRCAAAVPPPLLRQFAGHARTAGL